MSIFALVLAASVANLRVPAGAPVSIDTTEANSWIGSHIDVEGWDRPDVSIDQVVRNGSDGDVRPVVVRKGTTVSITAAYTGERKTYFFGLIHGDSNKSFRWVVHVPRNSAVRVREANGGVGVHAVTAALDVATVNGSIAVDAAGPNVDAQTSNGNLDIGIGTLAGGPPRLTLRSSNGHIHLRVPHGFETRIAAHTSNGAVVNPFVDASGPGSATLRTSNGGIDVTVGR
jgi:hypothetical protein